MIPHERSLVKKLEGKPFALIGVNSDSDREELQARLVKEQITWRQFYDGSTTGPIAKAWNVRGWPTTYVIDPQGIIRFKNVRDAEAEKAIESLLAEPPPEQPPAKAPKK
ncbi:MAG: TlpA family protein disulfide reductase [Planctomycetes bacterium]|nr:TlpA family protein disulfide reductase [Planctomycetota bacterium]